MKSTNLYPDNLFLLEFLVEKIEIYPKSLPPDLRKQKGGICLSLIFFQNEPLDICEEGFNPITGCDIPRNQERNGKSCLFALEPKAANNAVKNFDISVIVYKKLEKDELPNRVRIAETSVNIAEEFGSVMSRSWKEGNRKPITQTKICNLILKGTIPSGGTCMGDTNLFIRITCFGTTIVTQIKMNQEDNSVLFQDKEGKAMYKYVKRAKSKEESCPPTPYEPDNICYPPCPPRGPPPSPCGPPSPPCASPSMPSGFPSGFTICGPNPSCNPMCGLPSGSKMCYLPCLPSCFPGLPPGNAKDNNEGNDEKKPAKAGKNGKKPGKKQGKKKKK